MSAGDGFDGNDRFSENFFPNQSPNSERRLAEDGGGRSVAKLMKGDVDRYA